jgi:stage III sporulation protein AH
MKNRKRNLTMLAVLMFVCAAVALNWSYNNRWGTPDSEMVIAEDEAMMAANAAFEDSLISTSNEYFAEARLTRQVSRDEALELLQTAATSEAASQETIDSAMNAISAMATCTMQETQIENLLIAKDFTDCVVYIGNDTVTVAVPAPEDGLSAESVAIITDIICSETQYDASQLNIIEVKA